ncbi:hypothetical protein ACYSNM_11435 [Myroides sp. LJL116]
MIENSQETKGEYPTNYIIDLALKLPYELYINDILASSKSRGSNAAIEVNPYVLKNGKYKVKLKLFPFWQLDQTNIKLENISNSKVSFGYYNKDRNTGEIKKYTTVPLLLETPKQDIPYFEQEWEINITDLPYELEGWNNGQDLSQMDKKELEKKVITFHEKLHKILDSGDGASWNKITAKRLEETIVYDYITQSKLQSIKEINKTDIQNNCRNTMIPLDNYELKIYANGKLATLKINTHTTVFNNANGLDIYNWSPLIREGKASGAADYPVLLYLPQASEEFVIIR